MVRYKNFANIASKIYFCGGQWKFSRSLLTLKQGLLEIQNEKVIDTKVFNGLHDTILLLTEKLKAAGHPSFQKFLDDFETDISLMEKALHL
jgi:hypothetical protein